MEQIYLTMACAILMSSMVTGFITFRMQGMKMAVHFITLLIAFIATTASLIVMSQNIITFAVIFQILTTITAFTQMTQVLRYNFQSAPAYAPHLALVTMLPVLGLATLFQ